MSKEQQQVYCKPIQAALDLLVAHGCALQASEDGDPHFQEVNLVVSASDPAKAVALALTVPDIEQVGEVLRGTCHWSTIAIAPQPQG